MLEYCNFKGGTYYSDLRKSHGYKDPHNIKLWCLGKRWTDRGRWDIRPLLSTDVLQQRLPSNEIHGSDDRNCCLRKLHLTMPTFGSWEYTVLDECYDEVDYLSLHQYYGNYANDTVDFLASSKGMDDFISGVVAICDAVKAKKHGKKQINLPSMSGTYGITAMSRIRSWRNGYAHRISLRMFTTLRMHFSSEAC